MYEVLVVGGNVSSDMHPPELGQQQKLCGKRFKGQRSSNRLSRIVSSIVNHQWLLFFHNRPAVACVRSKLSGTKVSD